MLRDQPRATLPTKTASTLPRLWLFTDERNDLVLEEAIARLPRGSGIVFRHHHLPEPQRRKRFVAVKKLARRRGHLLVLAGAARMARRWGADGVHGRMVRRSVRAGLLHSAPVHDAGEIEQANRAGAGIFFLSPVFVTRSHPGQRPLNCLQTRRLAALCNGPVICLGGMDARRYRLRKDLPVHGWAAIDALS